MSESNASPTKDQPVTISAPPRSVEIDPQNPLPEPSFFWRRWITIVICGNALVFAWFAAAWLVGGEQWSYLYGLTKLVIYGAGLCLTYYFVAPSAAELVNLIQSASIIKNSLKLATIAPKQAENQPESGAGARFGASGATDSQIPQEAPGGPPRRLNDDLGDSGEIDAAPRPRT